MYNTESLQDDHSFHAEVDSDVELVANETQTHALADFLGDMWKEMRMFAVPFYKKHLKEKLEKLKAQEAKLQQEVADEKAGKKSADDSKEAKEEKEEKVKKEE